MSWKIIQCHIIITYASITKEMFHHKTLTGIPKHFPNNINKVICTIFYTEKMTTLPKGKTVDTTKIQPVEVIHMDLDFYNLTSI